MATPLMAPSSLPISRAFAVPTAWLHVPMATPWATLFLMWNKLASIGEKMAPITPVVMTAAMVIDAVPPSSPVTASAMGAVVDFGSVESATWSPRPNSSHSPYALTMETVDPTKHPTKIGRKLLCRILRC